MPYIVLNYIIHKRLVYVLAENNPYGRTFTRLTLKPIKDTYVALQLSQIGCFDFPLFNFTATRQFNFRSKNKRSIY